MYGYSKKVTNFKYEDLFEEKFKEVKKEIYVIKRRIDDIPKIEDKLDEITEIRKNVKELKLLLTNFINSKKEEIKEDEATLPEERGDSDNSKTPDHPIINNNNNESNNDSTTISKIESVISKIESTTSKIETTTSKIESTTSKIESDKDEKNKPIKIINEQEPIYDKRIKYIADALNINYENDIKSYKEKCKLCDPQEYLFVDEAYEEVAKWINWYFEIIKYIIYLKVEQKDLNDIIKVAYKKYDCNPKIIKILMDRFTEITNKINQVNNKYNDMISNLKNYVPEEITENNKIVKQAIQNIEFGTKSAFKPSRDKLIYNNSSFHINTDEIDKYVDKILLHLNRIRLINIYPSSSLLYKKVNTVNKMPIIELIDSIQQPTEDLLFERYKDKLYDNEFLFNNLSFYLNKNSFNDGSFKNKIKYDKKHDLIE